MKTRLLFWIIPAAVILLLGGVLLVWKHMHRPVVPTVHMGTLDRYPDFASQHIAPRTVSVWLPDNYYIGEPCEVLYMHDGQMLFDASVTWNHQAWQVPEIVSRLMAEGQIPRCIVVGIDNTEKRLAEYFPDKTRAYLPNSNGHGKEFHGDAYLCFLVQEVKPFIDAKYKPLTAPEHTFVMGSSMGGLISLYALCEYPDVFGGAACLSTHLSFAHLPLEGKNTAWAEAFAEYVRAKLPKANSCYIYIDHGTAGLDAAYGPFQKRLDRVFQDLNWDKHHYCSLIIEGADHNENCWAARLDKPLSFLFSPRLQKTLD